MVLQIGEVGLVLIYQYSKPQTIVRYKITRQVSRLTSLRITYLTSAWQMQSGAGSVYIGRWASSSLEHMSHLKHCTCNQGRDMYKEIVQISVTWSALVGFRALPPQPVGILTNLCSYSGRAGPTMPCLAWLSSSSHKFDVPPVAKMKILILL